MAELYRYNDMAERNFGWSLWPPDFVESTELAACRAFLSVAHLAGIRRKVRERSGAIGLSIVRQSYHHVDVYRDPSGKRGTWALCLAEKISVPVMGRHCLFPATLTQELTVLEHVLADKTKDPPETVAVETISRPPLLFHHRSEVRPQPVELVSPCQVLDVPVSSEATYSLLRYQTWLCLAQEVLQDRLYLAAP